MRRLIRPIATPAIVLLATAAMAADGSTGAPGEASPPAASAPPPAAAPVVPPAPPANGGAAPSQGGGTPAVVLDTQDYESLLGKSVRAMNGDDLGRIIDIIIDRDGRPRAAVIDFGGFLGVGSRKIAVDWRVLKFTTEGKVGRLTLQLNRNQVRVSPEYKAGEPIVVLGATSPGAAIPGAAIPPEGDAAAAEKAAAEKPVVPSDKASDRPQEKTPDR
ncbi:MAG TPA: PRC-barrel domain-containing protein [Methylobacterium sp.]|uniref:PRC-barrel domain-containing protein n=1 Tax=Methylorubrum sp. B1-46 TaxID=2897334 RepID=UPI001E37EF10|nr:PRC-barrel domain-containing protein [Methylorubrum sp. B1-46]UGB24365.1 PRC-barrel domain-containing protein [Methylorubrum sp. B1-46]HEV2544866.1 PRC-barrel domain-containing protein [Methylobacterium sp.]